MEQYLELVAPDLHHSLVSQPDRYHQAITPNTSPLSTLDCHVLQCSCKAHADLVYTVFQPGALCPCGMQLIIQLDSAENDMQDENPFII